jgi:hypothetical protein
MRALGSSGRGLIHRSPDRREVFPTRAQNHPESRRRVGSVEDHPDVTLNSAGIPSRFYRWAVCAWAGVCVPAARSCPPAWTRAVTIRRESTVTTAQLETRFHCFTLAILHTARRNVTLETSGLPGSGLRALAHPARFHPIVRRGPGGENAGFACFPFGATRAIIRPDMDTALAVHRPTACTSLSR